MCVPVALEVVCHEDVLAPPTGGDYSSDTGSAASVQDLGGVDPGQELLCVVGEHARKKLGPLGTHLSTPGGEVAASVERIHALVQSF